MHYVMTSYKHETEGQYLLAFHIGINEDITSDSGLTGGSEAGSSS